MPYVGNIEDVKWVYDPEEAMRKGSPILIDTPNLEVRVIVLPPGAYPPYHAHHEEMDEGYLIYGGRGLILNEGATFEVSKGDVLLNPRGAMHNMKNIGDGELIEFNFRGGRMPSGFLLPEGDPPPNPDPESVENPLAPPVPYIKGDIAGLTGPFDAESVKEKGLARAISTEYLECQIVSFPPGGRPHVHRHLNTMDEATLVLEGRMNFIIEEETIEASVGDLVHTPGGAWHTVHNASDAPAVLFNFRGGALPSRTEWRRRRRPSVGAVREPSLHQETRTLAVADRPQCLPEAPVPVLKRDNHGGLSLRSNSRILGNEPFLRCCFYRHSGECRNPEQTRMPNRKTTKKNNKAKDKFKNKVPGFRHSPE